MSKTLIVGIDPGRKGAIAFLDLQTENATVMDMPEDEDDLVPILWKSKDKICLVAIEEQQLIPKRRGNREILIHYGILIGIIKSLKLPYEEVPPPTWQKDLLGRGKRKRGESKRLSLKKAKALFPFVEIGDHHGRSDALLIAEWARRERYPYIANK